MNQVAGNGEKAYENVAATTTLKATEYKAPPVVCYAAGFLSGQGSEARGIGWQEEVAPCLRGGVTPDVCIRK